MSSRACRPHADFENCAFRQLARRAHLNIVACELRYGVAKKRSAELTRRLQAVLTAIEVLNLDVSVDLTDAQKARNASRCRHPIRANDLVIAAHALAIGATLVTDHESELSRVTGLRIENWLR